MCSKMRTICIQISMWCLLLAGYSQRAYARSVYVITKHLSSTVAAYDINDGTIDYQTTASGLPDRGNGAVGLALDPDSETLFVTYEKVSVAIDEIELINAKIMQVGQAPGAGKKKVIKLREHRTAFGHLISG